MRNNLHTQFLEARYLFLFLIFFFDTAIPLAAEEYLLKWLDDVFFYKAGKKSAYTNWIKLLQTITIDADSMNNRSDENDDTHDFVDMDLFEISEPNAFEEPIYTLYKCFVHLDKYIENRQERKDILSKFPCLLRFDTISDP